MNEFAIECSLDGRSDARARLLVHSRVPAAQRGHGAGALLAAVPPAPAPLAVHGRLLPHLQQGARVALAAGHRLQRHWSIAIHVRKPSHSFTLTVNH